MYVCCFFFQAEDGIRDGRVTGVQTCGLPILARRGRERKHRQKEHQARDDPEGVSELIAELSSAESSKPDQIGRASCREREKRAGGTGGLKGRKEEGRGRWRIGKNKRVVVGVG